MRLEITSDEYNEFIPRNVAQQMLTPPLSNRSTSPDARRSPIERNTLSRTKSDLGLGEDRSLPLPKTHLNEMGVPTHLMRFLEVIHTGGLLIFPGGRSLRIYRTLNRLFKEKRMFPSTSPTSLPATSKRETTANKCIHPPLARLTHDNRNVAPHNARCSPRRRHWLPSTPLPLSHVLSDLPNGRQRTEYHAINAKSPSPEFSPE